MVYCGKPSKGCQSCRERKIRCDQAIPSCSQCTRIDRKCEYRNLLDLSFRNESSAVIEKAKSKPKTRRKADAGTKSSRPKRLKAIPTTTVSSHADATNNWSLVEFSSHQQTHVTSPFSDQSIESDESYMPMPDYVLPNSRLSPNPDELAVGFFMTNYVTSRNFNARGHFAYVEDIGRRDGLNYVVTAAINSVGFAGLANQAGSPPLMRRARREYTNALRQVNSALQCNTRAVEDSTLMSIMVLSVFETITATGPTSMKAWTEHINGATALVKLRGRSQFDTPIGRSLFQQVTAHLLISCVQREIPIPNDIVELRAEAANYIDATDLSWLSLNSVADYTVFRAAVKDGTLGDSKSIIEAALKIDNDFAQTFSNVDSRWLYERVYTSPDIYPELIYDGSYDVYQNFWTSQVWNGMRTCRVLLNEVIREKLLEGFSAVPPLFTDAKYTAQLQKSTDTLIKMRDDILHSLPQHLGFVTRKPFSEQIAPGTPGPLDAGFARTRISPVTQFSDTVTDFTDNLDNWFSARHSQRPPTPSQTPPPSPVLKAAGGYFILWPLYVCAVAKVSSASTRTFITNRLRYIGESMGIKQALAIAKYLEIGVKILKQHNDIEIVD